MMQRSYSHELTVDRPAADAIGLFTPRGEEDWVPGWKPVYLRPQAGQTEEDMVFTTGDGEEKTFWTCLKWQPDNGHARYLRITPASRFAIVDVKCRPDGDERARVTVAYDIQSLTDKGEEWLEGFTQNDYAAMIDEWSELIRRSGH